MANKDLRYLVAQREAEKYLKDNGIHSLPVDPFAIAKKESLVVQAWPESIKGASGMLVKQQDDFYIFYATYIDNEGFQHFSVAHELGHFFLPCHIEQAIPDGQDRHYSYAGFTSQDPYEIEADNFASALLMPSEPFKKEVEKTNAGFLAIKRIAELCKTSLTATAIRYVQFAAEPCAVIFSCGSTVECAFMSKDLEQMKGLDWIKKGQPLPPNSLTLSINRQNLGKASTLQDSGFGDLADWFGGKSRGISEEVACLGNYGKTLTVITFDEDFEDQEDDEDDLIESYTPRFAYRR